MDRRKQEAMNWLAAQVAAARADGGMVHSSALHDALKAAFPDNPMTLDEVCSALVNLAEGNGIAVEFANRDHH